MKKYITPDFYIENLLIDEDIAVSVSGPNNVDENDSNNMGDYGDIFG